MHYFALAFLYSLFREYLTLMRNELFCKYETKIELPCFFFKFDLPCALAREDLIYSQICFTIMGRWRRALLDKDK